MKAIIVLSGGMDSTTLLYDYINNHPETKLYALSFHYGQKHSKELVLASTVCRHNNIPHQIITLPIADIVDSSSLVGTNAIPDGHYTDEVMKSTVVPNRNMIMLSIATAYAINLGASKVLYGAHAGDHDIYPDCREEFVVAMREVMGVCDYKNIELVVPYLNMSKGEVAARGLSLKVPYEWTWTCYKGQDLACGTCGSCVERLEAFEFAGAKDPIAYEVK